MRIISLLPSATEILYALGADNLIVGRSAESSFPSSVKKVPIVVSSKMSSVYSSKHIDKAVSNALKGSKSLYLVNNQLLSSLKPDLVITQKLCQVCAITPTDIQAAIRDTKPIPKIISLHPHSIAEIMTDIETVGQAINKPKQAKQLISKLQKRLLAVHQKTKSLQKPKVFCLEWLDPPYNAGHWVPEQVEISGGRDELTTKGEDSARTIWHRLLKYNPDFIILMPCGFTIARTQQELTVLTSRPEWSRLKAIQTKQVYLVNGPAYFNCSGPRVVDGVELLATILHPKKFQKRGLTSSDFRKLSHS